MLRRRRQTESLEKLKRPFGLAKGTPLSERMAKGRPRARNSSSKAGMARSLAGRLHGLEQSRQARGAAGDGERIAIAPVGELERAFEIGASKIIGGLPLGQRRAGGAPA